MPGILGQVCGRGLLDASVCLCGGEQPLWGSPAPWVAGGPQRRQALSVNHQLWVPGDQRPWPSIGLVALSVTAGRDSHPACTQTPDVLQAPFQPGFPTPCWSPTGQRPVLPAQGLVRSRPTGLWRACYSRRDPRVSHPPLQVDARAPSGKDLA